MEENIIWLTRTQASEQLNVSPWTITDIAREMVNENMDGVLLDKGGRVHRINPKAMADYMYVRRRLKRERKRSKSCCGSTEK